MTLHRRLRERNLWSRAGHYTPIISQIMPPEVQLQTCRARPRRNCADWGYVDISDESLFQWESYHDYQNPHKLTTESYGLGCHLLIIRPLWLSFLAH
ncbi:hypothetical protein TNCV_2145321 [Trichonephila clavipes]|uniref:Uncharacterized protein n=1 Tax=Trichonephila clavipes TaxID=2585209 RepID=A0A8X6VRX8_TRICX|nr:hypothetical protein TNCV_2145321 [Trichonephila clavipes]